MHRACHCIYSHIPVPFFSCLSLCFTRPHLLSARPLKLWHFRFPGDRACQAVAIATPCSLRPAQHQPTPLPHITPYPIARMWGLQRESTPAGFLLIGYFSFSLLPCFCLNFLPLTGLPLFLYLCVYCSPFTVDMVSHSLLLTSKLYFFFTFINTPCCCFFFYLESLNTTSSICLLSLSDPVSSFPFSLFILPSSAALS